jgi:hypothetical protein
VFAALICSTSQQQELFSFILGELWCFGSICIFIIPVCSREFNKLIWSGSRAHTALGLPQMFGHHKFWAAWVCESIDWELLQFSPANPLFLLCFSRFFYYLDDLVCLELHEKRKLLLFCLLVFKLTSRCRFLWLAANFSNAWCRVQNICEWKLSSLGKIVSSHMNNITSSLLLKMAG